MITLWPAADSSFANLNRSVVFPPAPIKDTRAGSFNAAERYKESCSSDQTPIRLLETEKAAIRAFQSVFTVNNPFAGARALNR